MLEKYQFAELLHRVSYHNAAEREEYFRETDARHRAVRELQAFLAPYARTEIEQAYAELLAEGHSFLITSNQWGVFE